MKIENKLSLGQVVIRIFLSNNSEAFTESLKENNHNFTVVDAQGKFGPVKMIWLITQRHVLNKAIKLIEEHNPYAFFSVEDIRYVKGGLPGGENPFINTLKHPFSRNSASNVGRDK